MATWDGSQKHTRVLGRIRTTSSTTLLEYVCAIISMWVTLSNIYIDSTTRRLARSRITYPKSSVVGRCVREFVAICSARTVVVRPASDGCTTLVCGTYVARGILVKPNTLHAMASEGIAVIIATIFHMAMNQPGVFSEKSGTYTSG